jgi:hypothetical protein
MTIRVIGAGMGRTGTLSLKTALEMLGFERCYHMVELLQNPHQVKYWEGLMHEEAIAWDELFAGYQATVDFPGYIQYAKIFRQYPEAKVILTVRDPEAWYASTKATVFQVAPSPAEKFKTLFKLPFSPKLRQQIRIFKMVDQLIWDGEFKGNFLDKDAAIARYHAHIAEVKATIPAEQLLVYDLSEGWQPLCEFLALPIPTEPIPHVNQRENFHAMAKKLLS